MKPLKEKKPFQAPHTFVILVVLILLAVAATYVVPAGEYTRYTDEATNRTLVEAGSFHYVESHPVSFLTVPALIYRAIVKAASTVTFILIIGGSFEIIHRDPHSSLQEDGESLPRPRVFCDPCISAVIFCFWNNDGNVCRGHDLCADRNCPCGISGT